MNLFETFTNDQIEALQMIFQCFDDEAGPDPAEAENEWFFKEFAELKKQHGEVFWDRFIKDKE